MTEEIKKIEKTELIEKELDSVTGGAASPPPPLTTKPAPPPDSEAGTIHGSRSNIKNN